MHHDLSKEMQQCIENCNHCHDVCVQTAHYYAKQGGKHVQADHLRLLADCIDICQTSKNFMLRESPLHLETCRACGVICEQCADDCEKMADDSQMKKCAEACRACAASCQEMAAMRT